MKPLSTRLGSVLLQLSLSMSCVWAALGAQAQDKVASIARWQGIAKLQGIFAE